MNWNKNIVKSLAAMALFTGALAAQAQGVGVNAKAEVLSADEQAIAVNFVEEVSKMGSGQIEGFQALNAKVCKLDLSPLTARIMSTDRLANINQFAAAHANEAADLFQGYCAAVKRVDEKARFINDVRIKDKITDAEFYRSMNAVESSVLDAGVALANLGKAVTTIALGSDASVQEQLAKSLDVSASLLKDVNRAASDLIVEAEKNRDASKAYQDFSAGM